MDTKGWSRLRFGLGFFALALWLVSLFLPFVTDVGSTALSLTGARDITYRGLFAFLWRGAIGLANVVFLIGAVRLLLHEKRELSAWRAAVYVGVLSWAMAYAWLSFDHNETTRYHIRTGYYLWASSFAILPIGYLLWRWRWFLAPLTVYLGVLLLTSRLLVQELHVVPVTLERAQTPDHTEDSLLDIYRRLPDNAAAKEDVWYVFANHERCPAEVLDDLGSWAVLTLQTPPLERVVNHPNTSETTLANVQARTEVRPALFREIRDIVRTRLRALRYQDS